MAVIENAGASPETLDAWKREMQTMQRGELMAQQLVQRGAEHALAELLRIGANRENCQAMLTSTREGLFTIHEVARARCIDLLGYGCDEPGSTTA